MPPNRRRLRPLVLMTLLTVVALPHIALAQILGGGGGGGAGVLGPIVTWIQGNLVTDLITLAIICVGACLMIMRFNPILVVCVCVGGWIMLNATTLTGIL